MSDIITEKEKEPYENGDAIDNKVIMFDSLKETINTADDGDVIFLEGFTYYCTEEITINKPLL